MNLHELQSQNVIERWFPAARFDDMQKLTDQVLGWPLAESTTPFLPQRSDLDTIRSYFGEEVATFFSFFCTLVRASRFPALIAVVVIFLRRFNPLGVTICWENSALAVCGLAVTIWGICCVPLGDWSTRGL